MNINNTPDLLKLHWLPVKERISFKILLITFKCLNNQLNWITVKERADFHSTCLIYKCQNNLAPQYLVTILII